MGSRRRVAACCLLVLVAVLGQVSSVAAQVGWGTPATISGASQTGNGIRAPFVAVDAAGNAIALFEENEGPTSERVMAARYDRTSDTWGTPQLLGQGCSIEPCLAEGLNIAVDDSGNALAVWVSRSGSGTDLLQSRRYVAASATWGAAETLSSGPSAVSPVLAMNASGDAVLFWLQQAGPPSGMLVRRLSGIGGTWSAPVVLTPTWSPSHAAAIDATGNAHVLWVAGTNIVGSRFDAGASTWSPEATVATGLLQPAAPAVRLAMNPAGDAVATWMRATTVESARYPAGGGSWTTPAPLSDAGLINAGARAVVDAAGNITVAWVQAAVPHQVLQVRRYTAASDTWSAPEPLGDAFAYPPPAMAVDGAGHVFVVWSLSLASPGIRLIGARYDAGSGQWRVTRNLSAISQSAFNANVGVDAAGNAIAVWFQSAGGISATQAVRWSALAGTPRITGVTPSNGSVAVAIDVADSGATTYEYSLNGGASWTARTPAGTASPLVITGLANGLPFALRVRAVNAVGAGAPTPVVPVRSGLDGNPSNFRIEAKAGTTVTFAWAPPEAGIVPTGYLLEGGVAPLQTLASISTGGTATTASFSLPVGSFSARIVAVFGTLRLGTSNELAFSVGLPRPPAAPTKLLGDAQGSILTLSWTNGLAEGAPTGLRLHVGGAVTTTVDVPLGESFAYPLMPAGTYTFAVSAVNASGASAPSAPITLTFPGGGCAAPPLAPVSFGAGVVGNVISLSWAAPPSGPPVRGYWLQVSGTFAGSLPVAGRTLSAPVPPGSYTIQVAATNACGIGTFTNPQTVVVP